MCIRDSQMGHSNSTQPPASGGGSGSGRKQPFRPANYKTVPCRLFHSPIGCERGEGCHFIHDYTYAGRETPNMQKYVRPLNKLSKNDERNKELLSRLTESQRQHISEGNAPPGFFMTQGDPNAAFYAYPPQIRGGPVRPGAPIPGPYGYPVPPEGLPGAPMYPSKGGFYPGMPYPMYGGSPEGLPNGHRP
eukprot:TRINITY_DN7868_c0_g1_i1.p1 TRINITY_DN7868_c0_g1~~TRINITY_DN7868_c0_g1_i1.p1  ORF type:complete len:190 (-),score=31.55 TRINITY_DN7868_c0_g1_i1:174-743(-)